MIGGAPRAPPPHSIGLKSVMWRNFRFQFMIDVEKSEIFPQVKENQIFSHNRCGEIRNFARFGGISKYVKNFEIYPVFGCEICFVAIYSIFWLICFVVIYALLCGKKLSRKLYRWRKNDKYEVWPSHYYLQSSQDNISHSTIFTFFLAFHHHIKGEASEKTYFRPKLTQNYVFWLPL